MDQIIYEINGKKYILIEEFFTTSTNQFELEKKIELHEGIVQSQTVQKISFDTKVFVALKILIPEEKVKAYSDYKMPRIESTDPFIQLAKSFHKLFYR